MMTVVLLSLLILYIYLDWFRFFGSIVLVVRLAFRGFRVFRLLFSFGIFLFIAITRASWGYIGCTGNEN